MFDFIYYNCFTKSQYCILTYTFAICSIKLLTYLVTYLPSRPWTTFLSGFINVHRHSAFHSVGQHHARVHYVLSCLSLQGGPAKVKPLTFLLVTFECIGKIQWFSAHVNYIQQVVMQILCKFCHNKHNTLDGATYDQHDCHRQTTWKVLFL